nr:hypothetical protein Iba_chr08dCG1280 [Ipomoea batatas]
MPSLIFMMRPIGVLDVMEKELADVKNQECRTTWQSSHDLGLAKDGPVWDKSHVSTATFCSAKNDVLTALASVLDSKELAHGEILGQIRETGPGTEPQPGLCIACICMEIDPRRRFTEAAMLAYACLNATEAPAAGDCRDACWTALDHCRVPCESSRADTLSMTGDYESANWSVKNSLPH